MKYILTLLALFAAPVAASTLPFPVEVRVADAQLATMRGGIRLPGGADVAVGIAIETQVNGVLALRTQYSTEEPGARVYAGGVAAEAPAGDGMAPSGPIITYDRNAAGATVTVTQGQPALAVSVGGSGGFPPAPGAPLPASVNGGPVATSLGTVSLAQDASGFTTTLTGPSLLVQQMIGRATGVVVANTANDQIINTQTWVSVDIVGFVQPSGLASSLAQAASAVAQR